MHFSSFQIDKFCDFLVGAGREKIGTRYYVGQVKKYEGDVKSQVLYASQQRTLQAIKNRGIYTVLGRIQRIGNAFREKGVDVRIGLDLLEGAYEDRYDTAIVISSDGDLSPAFEMVKRKGKKIESVMFDKKYSHALAARAETFRILNKSDLTPFGDSHNY